MDFIYQNPEIIWLFFGTLLVIMEALTIPGVGFLFSGFGAITVGILIALGIISKNNFDWQLAVFLCSSVVWAFILWKPIKNYVNKSNSKIKLDNNNIVGQEVEVVKDLIKNKVGQVKWSGTIMKAKIDEESKIDKINKGKVALVKDVNGNILIIDLI